MNKQEKTMKRREQETRTVVRKFYGWPMSPWTPEQVAEAVRRHPDQTVFWRSAYERKVDTAMKMAHPEEDLTGNCAADWRARECLVLTGWWDSFVAVETRGRRAKGQRRFLVVRD